jgi:hypothetical protein
LPSIALRAANSCRDAWSWLCCAAERAENSLTLLLFALTAIWARLLASLLEAPPNTVPLGNVTDCAGPPGVCMDSCSG